MSFAHTTVEIPPPSGPAVVRRNLPIEYIVEERSATTGAWSAKDISGARYTYQLRLWTADADAAVLDDQTITKGSDSASGELKYDYPCGTTVQSTLRWEIVELDNSTANADSNSGQVERILAWWLQPIIDAP